MYLTQDKLEKLKKRRKRRLVFIITSLSVLVAVSGLLVFRTPIFLEDAAEIIKSARAELSSSSLADEAVNDILSRGTIFDRNFQELAVSYKIFSLYASPAKIGNHAALAEKLVPLTGRTSADLLYLLGKQKRVVKLADNLGQVQVEKIRELSFPGLFLRDLEKRFYPGHAYAAHIIGYVSDGIGLAGMEGRFDLLLQPGEYQASMVPEVDFQGYTFLGRAGTDLMLTLDLGLQKKIDRYLLDIMAQRNAGKAMAILLDPWTGRVLSLSNLPSFDANRFLETSEKQRENRAFSKVLSYDLVRPILTRAAAVMEKGLQAESLLPTTVAIIDFGLGEEEINRLTGDLCFRQPIYEGVLPLKKLTRQGDKYGHDDLISLAQIGVGLASLINGGWRIAPVFLDSVYDRQEKKIFPLNRQAVSRKLVICPIMGVVLRRHLFPSSEDNGMIALASSVRVVPAGVFSHYVQQELFAGIIRDKNRPSLLLLIAVEQNNLAPFALLLDGEKSKKSLKEHGKSLIAALYIGERGEKIAVSPPAMDKDNKLRFLLLREIKYISRDVETRRLVSEMPSVVGYSLREGLQILNQHNCRVIVKGSGRIISQYPAPRQRLQYGAECILSLDVSI